ncbi:MAG: NAD+ synthase [Candidatus Thermoplasmatota archaeon]|nr:NAD+ synthase [Candidatus Thermoplasmatota archaeon]
MTTIALLQFDPTVGDLDHNGRRLAALAQQALSGGAKVGISTELAVCGYPPRDLLMERDFVERSMVAALTLETPLPVLVGTPIPSEDERTLPTNGVVRAGPAFASITGDEHGRIVAEKQLLPTYDVFDEARYFTPKNRSGLARSFGGFTLGVTVCEDAWQSAGMTPSSYTQDPIEHIAEWCRQGVDIDATVNLSASPFHSEKFTTRLAVARHAAAVLGHPFLLANQVGGNDDLLFDGRSLAVWPDGRAIVAPSWQEGVLIVDISSPEACQWVASDADDALAIGEAPLMHLEASDDGTAMTDAIEELTNAVVAGLADYCRKSSITSVVLGLSGGIDSAVAACVAVAALGAENVTGLAMPSRHSSQHSIDDAIHTAKALGMAHHLHEIDAMHTSVEGVLGEVLANGHPVAAENLQARLRALLVMGYANANASMAITTGNKSEIAQGYCTLYGDMAGGYAPLGDVYKMEVYAMAERFNQRAEASGRTAPVSTSTMTKPPSAELAPDQTDQDSLPPYDELDAILRSHIEGGLNTDDLIARGFEAATVMDVLQRLERNEHKRWQMPPAPRVSPRAFGQGWRRPLASNHDWRR